MAFNDENIKKGMTKNSTLKNFLLKIKSAALSKSQKKMMRSLGGLVLALLLTGATALREMSFADLEDEKGQKVVVFYDSGSESSDALQVLEDIAADSRLGAWEPVKVNVEADINVAKVKEAGFKKFPQVFTNSASGGVEVRCVVVLVALLG